MAHGLIAWLLMWWHGVCRQPQHHHLWHSDVWMRFSHCDFCNIGFISFLHVKSLIFADWSVHRFYTIIFFRDFDLQGTHDLMVRNDFEFKTKSFKFNMSHHLFNWFIKYSNLLVDNPILHKFSPLQPPPLHSETEKEWMQVRWWLHEIEILG